MKISFTFLIAQVAWNNISENQNNYFILDETIMQIESNL